MNIQAIIDDMLQSKEVAKAKAVQDKVSEMGEQLKRKKAEIIQRACDYHNINERSAANRLHLATGPLREFVHIDGRLAITFLPPKLADSGHLFLEYIEHYVPTQLISGEVIPPAQPAPFDGSDKTKPWRD